MPRRTHRGSPLAEGLSVGAERALRLARARDSQADELVDDEDVVDNHNHVDNNGSQEGGAAARAEDAVEQHDDAASTEPEEQVLDAEAVDEAAEEEAAERANPNSMANSLAVGVRRGKGGKRHRKVLRDTIQCACPRTHGPRVVLRTDAQWVVFVGAFQSRTFVAWR